MKPSAVETSSPVGAPVNGSCAVGVGLVTASPMTVFDGAGAAAGGVAVELGLTVGEAGGEDGASLVGVGVGVGR